MYISHAFVCSAGRDLKSVNQTTLICLAPPFIPSLDIFLFSSMWFLRYFSLAALVASLAIDPPHDSQDLAEDKLGPSDYFELKKFANLASVAYCLNAGLRESKSIGNQGDTCPSAACSHDGIDHYKVLKTFRFGSWFDVGSSFIAVDHQQQTLYLTFRGTASIPDWINNFAACLVDYTPLVFSNGINAKLQKCDECKIHRGFNSFVLQNGIEVVKEMIKLKKEFPDYHIVVTGHSLGGAMALLTGVELRLLGYDALVVTLAGPKVGNQEFVDFANKLLQTEKSVELINIHKSFERLDVGYVRMIHKHDIVPLLPPSRAYHHGGYEYYLSNRGAEQTPDSVIRRGIDYVEDSDMSYHDMIPSGFNREDHVNYFFPVTSCNAPET